MAAESSSRSADNSEFKWGEVKDTYGQSNTFYTSMWYKGVRYSVDDCAFLRSKPGHRDHIGKLMSLFEENGKRKIRVRWFLRAEELVKQPEKVDLKEVFIAMGSITGVENVLPVETILRKATVLCTALHPDGNFEIRKHLPNRLAWPDSVDHIFSKAYDAIDKKPRLIAKLDVEMMPFVKRFFNKVEWLQALDEEPTNKDNEEFEGEDVEEIGGVDVEEATGSRTLEQLENIGSVTGIPNRIEECQPIAASSSAVAMPTSPNNVAEVVEQVTRRTVSVTHPADYDGAIRRSEVTSEEYLNERDEDVTVITPEEFVTKRARRS